MERFIMCAKIKLRAKTSEMQQLSVFLNLLFGEWAIKLQACPYLTRLNLPEKC